MNLELGRCFLVKRTIIFLALLFCLTGMLLSASAGDFYEITIAAEGGGVQLYTVPRGRAAGLLYNGYLDDDVDDEKEQNGWFPLSLTDEYTLYVHEATATKLAPDTEDPRQRERLRPCSAFVGQVIENNAVMRAKPDKRSRLIARHAAGSQFIVWGEFGAYYLVETGSSDLNRGFIPQSSIVKMRGLTYTESRPWNRKDGPVVDRRTVYCEAGGVPASDSAAGISEIVRTVYRNGETVSVIAYLPNGWAQLQDGSFIHTRYLDPQGDHSPAKTALIKPTTVLNRLNVRVEASANGTIYAKLCSGVEVEIVSETEDWAVISLVGPATAAGIDAGILCVRGCVQKKYLTEPGNKAPDGTVKATAVSDLRDDGRLCAPKGSTVTVLGTDDGWYRDGDRLLIRGEDGALFWINHSGNQLEPVAYPEVSVKTREKARMRGLPDDKAETVVTLRRGVRVQVLLRGERWTMVSYDGQKGYVESRFLRFP